ncbi:CIA30 family protein [Thalassotalea maritima]|uniref:CIA30 family protein n=1 Tax=Thalassotalea maritima TaxID=3242416 RepID=UPI0035293FD8
MNRQSSLRAAIFFIAMSISTSSFANVTDKRWYIINDDVMGGRSDSQITTTDNSIIFSGTVSLENDGGFASIRAAMQSPENSTNVQIIMLGDGKTYQLRLRSNRLYDGPAFVHEFKTIKGQWQTLIVDKNDFHLQYRGRKLTSTEQVDIGDIEQIGFLISGKQEGEFSLQIKSIVFLTQI